MPHFLALIQAAAAGAIGDQVLSDATLYQLAATIAVPYIQEWLKNRHGFPWLTPYMTEANVLISVLSSFGTAALGLTFSSSQVGDRSMFCVAYPGLNVMIRGVLGYIGQRVLYQRAIKPKDNIPPPSPPLVGALPLDTIHQADGDPEKIG